MNSTKRVMTLAWLTPVVVSGKNHTINHQVNGKKMVMPFSHSTGNLYLEMCFNK